MTIRRVLKAFRFSLPAKQTGRLSSELIFAPGDHDIPDEVLAHPWMQGGADGSLETHEAAVERTKKAQVHAEHQADIAAKAQRDAQAALSRLEAAHKADEPNRRLAADQLNQSVGTIRARQDGVNMEDPEFQKALNTPLNALPVSTPGTTGEQSDAQVAGATPNGGSNLPGSPTQSDVTSGAADPGAPPPELTDKETSTDEGTETDAEGKQVPKAKGKKGK
jgi:hypothetical protein